MGLSEDIATYKRIRHDADVNAIVVAQQIYPHLVGPRMRAVYGALGHKINMQHVDRGATSPLGGAVGNSYGLGRPTVAARLRRA